MRWWSNDNGDGLSWTVEVIASSATGVTDVDVGDIDADGDLDVVGAVTGAGEVRWWQQTASGWTPRVLAGNPTGVNDVALGDADGDGYLDVFGLVPGFSKIVWWENPRPGTGVPWTRTDVDTEDDPVGLAVVDLDRDGDDDVIVGDVLQDTLAWWANDGSGAAGTWTRTSIGGLSDPTSTFPVDLDLDGDVDVLATGDGGGGSVGWFESSGGAASWTWHEIAVGAAAFGAVAADTDRDGDPDVAWANPVAGMVEDASNLMAHRGAAFSFEYIGVGGVGLQMFKGPSLGDIDGDGDLDIASHTGLSAQYRWWEQQSPTTWVQRDIDAIPSGGGLGADVKGIDLADMDLDGDLDLLGTYELKDQGTFVEGAYVWYENDVLATGSVVEGTVEPGWTRHEMPFGGPATPVYALDLDGDGVPESSDPVIVTLTSAPTVTDGMADFAFPGVSSDRTIPCCSQEQMFSVWMEVGAAASAAGLPDPVQISFEGPTVSAVDTVDELAVTVSPYFEDAAVQFTVIANVDETIFADGFETGDTTLWTSATP